VPVPEKVKSQQEVYVVFANPVARHPVATETLGCPGASGASRGPSNIAVHDGATSAPRLL